MEIWKDIPNFEGYQVSNLGRIKSLKKKQEIILIPKIKRGYYQIGIRKNGVRKWCQLHRLIAQTFIPNPDKLPQVNHKDENKLNNVVENLEWCTVSYNNNYGTRQERVRRNNKLRKEVTQYDMNMNKINTYISISEAHRKTNVNISGISRYINGKQSSTGGYIWKYKSEVMPDA